MNKVFKNQWNNLIMLLMIDQTTHKFTKWLYSIKDGMTKRPQSKDIAEAIALAATLKD